MTLSSRREFVWQGLSALTTYALLKTLAVNGLFASPIRPSLNSWISGLNEICGDMRRDSLSLVEWQQQVESLLQRVPLSDLVSFIDLDGLSRSLELPNLGAAARPVDFPKLEGVPRDLLFFKKIFGLRKNRAIIPHGHRNMVSAHLVLEGEFELRHYDKIAEDDETMVIEPTIHATVGPGEASSISDEKNNVHWFRTLSDRAFTFDMIVTNIDPDYPRAYDVDNIDPLGAEELPGGRLRAKKLAVDEALKAYGKQSHHEERSVKP